MTERKLASIRRISEVLPIEGADRIVLAKIDGWQLITQKDNNFKPNDLVVYFEVDSFLPVSPQFEFLRDKCFKSTKNLGDGFRLRTMKMRGQISQGLILPIEVALGDLFDQIKDKIEEGLDLTELLGVQKYEKPIPANLVGKVRSTFPSAYIRKTDQERVQNLSQYLPRHSNESFEITVKLDGSSMTVFKKDDDYGICSRNMWLKNEGNDDNLFVQTAMRYRMFDALKDIGRNLAFQGELMGPGVQNNYEQLKTHQFYLFDIFDIDSQCYLKPRERHQLFLWLKDRAYEFEHVPVVDYAQLPGTTPQDILDYVEKFDPNFIRTRKPVEGFVFKSLDSDFTFKAISNTWLLKNDG